MDGLTVLIPANASAYIEPVAMLVLPVFCVGLSVTLMRIAGQKSDRMRFVALAAAVMVLGLAGLANHHWDLVYRPREPGADGSAPHLFWEAVIMALGFGGSLMATVLIEDRRIRATLGACAGGALLALHAGDSAHGGVALSPLGAMVAMLPVCALLALAMSLPRRGAYWFAIGTLIAVSLNMCHEFGEILQRHAHVASEDHIGNSGLTDTVVTLMLSIGAVVLGIRYIRLDSVHRDSATTIESQAETLSAALHNMTNGLLMITPERTIRLHNDRLLELLDLPGDAIKPGQPVEELLRRVGAQHDWSQSRIDKVIETHLKWLEKTEMTQTEFFFEDGRVLSVACCPMPDGSGVITYHDVTSERRVHAEMAHMAYHDALTGLPNLRSFQQEMHTALGSHACPAVMMLDLDRFKAVNDTLGHSVGDELLVQVAQRLRECSRPTDLIFRLGGDEFAMLPGRLAKEQIVPFARRIVESLSQEFTVEGHLINIGSSVGIAFLDEDASDEADLQIQKADLALYRAKRLGRGRVECYEPGMIEEAIEKRKLEADLLRALEANEFVLHYQPICSASERRLLGFEALIRWRHPERGLLSPQCFIPLAEETGLIKEIGLWVLAEACREVAHWPDDLHVAVNVSPVQLRAPGLVAELAKSLLENGLTPGRVEVELTETALIEDGEGIAAVLKSLRELGIRISMDDFGTGYSSLAHLRDFQLDRIKIDRSFVDRPADDFGAASVVRAVTNIARDLGITTVAEGVETTEQLERLTEIGCNSVQGFLLGRPIDSEGARAMIFAEAASREAGNSLREAS